MSDELEEMLTEAKAELTSAWKRLDEAIGVTAEHSSRRDDVKKACALAAEAESAVLEILLSMTRERHQK